MEWKEGEERREGVRGAEQRDRKGWGYGGVQKYGQIEVTEWKVLLQLGVKLHAFGKVGSELDIKKLTEEVRVKLKSSANFISLGVEYS